MPSSKRTRATEQANRIIHGFFSLSFSDFATYKLLSNHKHLGAVGRIELLMGQVPKVKRDMASHTPNKWGGSPLLSYFDFVPYSSYLKTYLYIM